MNLWCKLWNFFLNMFISTVHAVAYALDTVGGVLIDLASKAIKGVSSALGSPIALIGVGVLAWFLLGRKSDDGGKPLLVNAAVPAVKGGL